MDQGRLLMTLFEMLQVLKLVRVRGKGRVTRSLGPFTSIMESPGTPTGGHN